MELPEKQGLKQQADIRMILIFILVAVELPEKQGLKQMLYTQIFL